MKAEPRILLILTLLLSPLYSLAGGPTKYFEELSTKPEYNYNYVSPTMLKAMGDIYMTQSAGNLPIKTGDITSIENISTMVNGQDEDLWTIISNLKKAKNMETLTTKKQNNYRYDVLANLTKDGKHILHLLVVTQNGGNCVDVIYMTGKIPMERLKYAFRNQ